MWSCSFDVSQFLRSNGCTRSRFLPAPPAQHARNLGHTRPAPARSTVELLAEDDLDDGVRHQVADRLAQPDSPPDLTRGNVDPGCVYRDRATAFHFLFQPRRTLGTQVIRT